MPRLQSLKPSILAGLRQDSRFERNRPCLSDCSFSKVLPFGIRPHQIITEMISDNNLLTGQINNGHSDVVKVFPFPHIIRGKGVTLLMDDTYIYQVSENGANSTLTALATFDFTTPANPYNGGDAYLLPNSPARPWQFADLHDSWFLFNTNGDVVFKTKWEDSTKVFVVDEVTVRTGCTFNGRMIMGGFNESDFWTADHIAIWTTILSSNFAAWGFDLPDGATIAPKRNWVWWSCIGGGDTLGFFDAVKWAQGSEGIGTDDSYTSTVPFFLDMLRVGQSAFLVMPFQGFVVRTLPLGNNVMVYGTDGIAAIFPSAAPGVPTFGLRGEVLPIGVDYGSMIGGTDKRHVFLDRNHTLWTIDADLQLTRLGYEEYFTSVSHYQISHDPEYDEFYISNEEACFVLANGKLSEYPGVVNSFTMRNNLGSALGLTATECVKNGSFTGGVTEWTLDTGITDGTGHIALAVGGTSWLSQSRANAGIKLTDLHVYEFTFTCTITNPGSGVYIQPRLHPGESGTNAYGTQRATSGTYIETILSSSNSVPLVRLKVVGVTGTIDDVSVVPKGTYVRTGWMSSEDGDVVTIKGVRVIADDYSNISVAIDHVLTARDGLSDFETTDFVAVDGRGFANIPVAAFDFRVIVMSTDFSDTNIDDIAVVFSDEKIAVKERLTD